MQTISADAEVGSEQAELESDIHESSSTHPKPTTQTSEPSVLENLVNHYSGELLGFMQNLEKASEIASEEVVLEDPQQHQPELEPESPKQTLEESHQPEFDATFSNFASSAPGQSVLEHHVLEHVLADQPESHTSFEQITELDFMITSDSSDGKDEQTNSWFKPGFLSKFSSSSSTKVSKFVPDLPSETITHFVEPNLPSTTDIPSSSNLSIQACAPARTTSVPSPPTLFLDSTILVYVCENIFQELYNHYSVLVSATGQE